MKAIRFERTGGPEVLELVEVERPEPKAGEIRIAHTAIGVNYIDTYYRSGLYPARLPSGLGVEAVGRIDAIGDGVEGFAIGDRVGYCMAPIGAYADASVIPANRAVRIPEGVSDDIAASILLKGMTAEYLLLRTYPVQPGDTILFHAAAGGVGQIACQWAKALGATVIGTVGSDAKVDIARANGCDHVIVTSRENIAARVKEITNGAGVPVSYDGVGKDTWEATLKSLKPRGLFASFGNSSGPVPPIAPSQLATKSLFLTRPGLAAYIATREELEASSHALFDVILSGAVKIAAPSVFPLAQAAQVHRDLQDRKTTGSLVLHP